MDKKIMIMVPTIKKYKFPFFFTFYYPIQVGRDETDEELGYICDNTGDNISYKHRFYSELSAVYWAWKNCEYDYLGLCHHRRYFAGKTKNNIEKPFSKVLSKEELECLLSKCPVILAKKRHYVIETKESQFIHSHGKKEMDICRSVISELYPDCLCVFNKVMKRTWQHNYNMFVMDRYTANSYCEWLFAILFEIEKRIDLNTYNDPYSARILGYLGERLLDVFIEYKHISYQEVKVIMLEKQNTFKKYLNFIRRKIRPKVRRQSD